MPSSKAEKHWSRRRRNETCGRLSRTRFMLVEEQEHTMMVGVWDIYRNCCFNDVRYDILEYFAKTIQNAHIHYVKSRLQCVLSLHDSV